jgi:hypothetical protein
MTATAYKELIASGEYSYRRLAHQVDGVLDRYARSTSPRPRRMRIERSARLLGIRAEEAGSGRGYVLSHLLVAGRTVLRRSTEARLVLTQPPLTRLLTRGRRRLAWGDLTRLAIATAARRGRLRVAESPFSVGATWDAVTGTLTLRSNDAGESSGSAPASSVLTALADGTIVAIRWVHLQHGGTVWLRAGARRLVVEVGEQGTYGVHSFDTIVELSRERPAEVAAALAPFFQIHANVHAAGRQRGTAARCIEAITSRAHRDRER